MDIYDDGIMNREELYAMLDIETPADFEYFENIAALFESEDELEDSALLGLIEGVDKDSFAELIDQYFDDIMEFIPDDAAEVFTLMEQIRRGLTGMVRSLGEEKPQQEEGVSVQEEEEDDGSESILVNLADEIEKFRRWYSVESQVYCTPFDGGSDEVLPVRDALVLVRTEKLTDDKYEYDFSECLDYPLEEYSMSFGELLAATEDDD